MSTLSRRECIVQRVFAWTVAVCLGWVDLLLLAINHIAMIHYAHASDGKPLPLRSSVCAAPTSPLYWFPLPALLFALSITFSTRFTAYERLAVPGACLALGIAAIATIAVGTALPAIPFWKNPLTP